MSTMVDDERFLIITPENLAFSVLNPNRDLLVHLDIDPQHFGLRPGLGLAIRMTPTEARRIAQTLARKADEAEAGLPRA
jgi:ethanolamine utilization microcompartment shell protein EutS